MKLGLIATLSIVVIAVANASQEQLLTDDTIFEVAKSQMEILGERFGGKELMEINVDRPEFYTYLIDFWIPYEELIPEQKQVLTDIKASLDSLMVNRSLKDALYHNRYYLQALAEQFGTGAQRSYSQVISQGRLGELDAQDKALFIEKAHYIARLYFLALAGSPTASDIYADQAIAEMLQWATKWQSERESLKKSIQLMRKPNKQELADAVENSLERHTLILESLLESLTNLETMPHLATFVSKSGPKLKYAISGAKRLDAQWKFHTHSNGSKHRQSKRTYDALERMSDSILKEFKK